jgi:hypothetical protein
MRLQLRWRQHIPGLIANPIIQLVDSLNELPALRLLALLAARIV